jgi:hypothetical protein
MYTGSVVDCTLTASLRHHGLLACKHGRWRLTSCLTLVRRYFIEWLVSGLACEFWKCAAKPNYTLHILAQLDAVDAHVRQQTNRLILACPHCGGEGCDCPTCAANSSCCTTCSVALLSHTTELATQRAHNRLVWLKLCVEVGEGAYSLINLNQPVLPFSIGTNRDPAEDCDTLVNSSSCDRPSDNGPY